MSSVPADARPIDDKAPDATQAQVLQATTAPSEDLRLHRLSTTASLQQLLDSARTGLDEETRYTALRVAALCATLAQLPDRRLALQAHFSSDPQRLARVEPQLMQAHQRLQGFCAGGDAQAWLDSLREGQITLGESSRAMHRECSRSLPTAGPWQIVMLSNPAQYSAALDHCLDRHARTLLGLPVGLGSDAEAFLVDGLYQRLTGSAEPAASDSLRSAYRCAVHLVCPSSLALDEAERQALTRQLDRLERLIREQRWNELSRPAGG